MLCFYTPNSWSDRMIVKSIKSRKSRKSQNSCVFCREQGGSKNTNFSKLYPELENRILLRSDNLTIFPCLGQLSPKHSLIITKQHFNTFAQALKSEITLGEEVSILISDFKKQYVENHETLLIFEHGAVCSDHGGCGIYHSHIHLVPIVNKVSIFSLYEFSNSPHYSLAECFANINPKSSYVFAGYFEEKLFINQRAQPLPSQYLRKKLASELDVDEWDWRKYQRQYSLPKMLNLALASR